MSNIGILGVNKPAGMTSFDVVRQIKKETGIKKIGHGGTLDPMATGVLPILFNEATAFFDVLLNSVKIYETEIQLGTFTDTDDKEGQITETLPVKEITLEEIKKHIESLTGTISQIPPQYSALKVDGKRAYDLAREGKEVVLKAREVTVYLWDTISYDTETKIIKARIHCGSGTYIRSLGKDLAIKLQTAGHLISLRRVSSGGIDIKNTIEFEDIASKWQEKFISPEDALAFLPLIEWEGDKKHLLHGKPLVRELCKYPSKDGIYRLMYAGRIVALLEYKERRLSYKKNLMHLYKDAQTEEK